jgi:hypothetical protein
MTISKQRGLALLAAAVFLGSLLLPAYVAHSSGSPPRAVPGAEVLVAGFMGFVVGEIRWFANPIFLYVVLALLFNWKLVIPTVLGALLVGTSFSLLLPYHNDNIRLAVGAYVWGASLTLAAMACFIWRVNQKRANAV